MYKMVCPVCEEHGDEFAGELTHLTIADQLAESHAHNYPGHWVLVTDLNSQYKATLPSRLFVAK